MSLLEPTSNGPDHVPFGLTLRGRTLSLRGEIDLACAEQLDTAMRFLLETPDPDVIIDTTGVTFLDLAGLQPVLTAVQRLTGGRGRITFSAVSQPVEQLLGLLRRVDPGALAGLAGIVAATLAAPRSEDAAVAAQHAATDLNDRGAVMHAMDGDGASICEKVAPAELRTVDGLTWPQISDDARCTLCALVVGAVS